MIQMNLNRDKSLWQQHGKWVITLFAVFLLTYGGMQFYGHYQSKRALKASLIYDKLLSLSQAPDKKEAIAEAAIILSQYPKTVYAPMASLLLAKFALDENNLDATKQHLQFAIKSNSPVQPIARVRLARVLADQKDLTEALKLLTQHKVPESFIPMFEETKGDIYLMQNDKAKAREAYEIAIKAAQKDGIPVARLQLKQADLGK